MNRENINDPAVRAFLMEVSPLCGVDTYVGLMLGVMNPGMFEDDNPAVLICNTGNIDNETNGNEVVILTLEQAATLLASLPKIVSYLQEQGYPLPEGESLFQ